VKQNIKQGDVKQFNHWLIWTSMLIKITPQFEKQYKKLPLCVKEQAKQKESIFRQDQFSTQLKTHKLHGKDKACWAFWITRSYRIKFIFISSQEVLFLAIGPHSIYK